MSKINLKTIEEPSITKQMLKDSFVQSYPYPWQLMEAYLKKCSVNELIGALASNFLKHHSCWGQSVNNREECVSKVLSTIVYSGWGPGGIILKAFIGSELVEIEDIQSLMMQQGNLLTAHSIFLFTQHGNLAKKYPIGELLGSFTSEYLRMLNGVIKDESLDSALSEILAAKEADKAVDDHSSVEEVDAIAPDLLGDLGSSDGT